MNILHLTTFLQGGAGRVMTQLAVAQVAAGHDVRVVTSETAPVGYGNYAPYLDQLRAHGVAVDCVDSLFRREHAASLAVVRLLEARYPDGHEPDVVHAHAAVPALIGLVFAGARRTSCGLVQTMHGWGVAKSAEQAESDVTVLNLVDRVVVPSRQAMRQLTSLGVQPARIAVIPYGISGPAVDLDASDLSALAEMSEARQQGALVVACVGTFGARKNQVLLVHAAAQTAAPVFLVFIGDGDDRMLTDAVRSCGLTSRVRVQGFSPAARRLAAAADVLVLPSRNEGLPLAILEAFADGTLVVVSDIPELTELVQDGVNGFCCEGENAASLASVLDRVAGLSDAERQTIRDRARTPVGTAFTVTGMCDAYEALYQASLTSISDRRRTEPTAA